MTITATIDRTIPDAPEVVFQPHHATIHIPKDCELNNCFYSTANISAIGPVRLANSSYKVNESDKVVRVCFEANVPSQITLYLRTADGEYTANCVSHEVYVHFIIYSETAVAGTDYLEPSDGIIVTVTNEFYSDCWELPIIDDSCSEPTEKFQVFLELVTEDLRIVMKRSSANVSITDHDPVNGQN